ncbi:MAG: outer membrane protein transport protein [Pseudomonadota bacterium]
MNKINKLLAALFLVTASHAYATDGYFTHGYGIKAQSAGGVGIALPQDAIAGATNPAGISWVDDQVYVGATWFRPQRNAEIEGSAAPVNGSYDGNDTESFIIPEFAYKKSINDAVAGGISIYGNGGLNTDYKDGFPLFGNSRAGVNLIQLFVSPTLSWKPTPTQSIGVSLNLAYQRFKAEGLQNFDNALVSASPGHVTNEGSDSSYGAGIHVGWVGQVSDNVTLGATYQSKTYMTKFDRYKGLFADSGSFDIPTTYGLGAAVKLSPSFTLAADVQRILYGDVDSISNAGALTSQLGSSNGPGFGWDNVTVYKLGAIYAYDDAITLRIGYNHSSQPIGKSQTLFNVLAPGIIQDHFTLGGSYKFANKSELSLSYIHAFENKVNGSGSIPAAFGGGEANIKMYQDAIGIAYNWQL